MVVCITMVGEWVWGSSGWLLTPNAKCDMVE